MNTLSSRTYFEYNLCVVYVTLISYKCLSGVESRHESFEEENAEFRHRLFEDSVELESPNAESPSGDEHDE
uniref:Uncharacterized protein n=1 Tax=Caenorhabditis japonica TaxID=281687 RepID=A0A8R1IRH1_CAEJA